MLISVQDISIRAGSQVFFEHTHWNIEIDQHWAILGPTGSGKSVLARALAHQLPILRGQILYFFDQANAGTGRPYLNRHEVASFSAETHREFLRQFVNYHQARWQSFEGQDVPTVAGLLEHKSLFTQSPYEILPSDRSSEMESFQQQRAEIIALFGLQPLLERKVHLLSHGESRKVFLSRLLLRSPRLLILDDPFTGLDENARLRFHAALEKLLEKQQPAILLVTSQPHEIPAGINQLLLVEDKRVIAQGDRARLEAGVLYSNSPARSPSSLLKTPAAFERMVEQYTTTQAERSRAGENAQPEMPPLVQMQDVCITYGETEVLKHVNWTVQQGERWALLGPNGAGKSTLLSLILADNPQAYGRLKAAGGINHNAIALFGQQRGSGESIWEIKRRIGWVSPELHIFYEKTTTCRDVIASGWFDSVGLYHQCSTEQASAVELWMQILDIESLAEVPFDLLSSGQQRMALLGRAMVKNPPLLVLDEPCQGLDSAHRALFVQWVDQICARVPITLIYVTHYQDELPAAITHRLLLNRGQVIENSPIPPPNMTHS